MDAKASACLDAIHGALYDGESPDPNDHKEDRAWLDGYGEGLAFGRDEDHGIMAEFHRRGYVSGDHANSDPAWKSWKRGFNAGSLNRAMSIATGERGLNRD